VPKTRGYVTRSTTDVVELRFTYLGATQMQEPLASGASRQQFGLKLRAADACNLLYVMWRLAPSAQIVVSEKTNPDEHTSAQCGNHGYHDLVPELSDSIPALQPGVAHRLRARIDGRALLVWADDKLVWRGGLSPNAVRLVGPVGFRTDNVRLRFQLSVENAPGPSVPIKGDSDGNPGCQ
jgi:hypothetical protein